MSPADKRQEEVAAGEAARARTALSYLRDALEERAKLEKRIVEHRNDVLGSLSVINELKRLDGGWLAQFLEYYEDGKEMAAELMRFWSDRRIYES